MASYSVLPPPSRYPIGTYPLSSSGAPIPPLIETSNILSHPDISFLAGDGAYVLQDDLHLSKPPPFPLETTTVNPNPLATGPQAVRAGTSLSLVSLAPSERPTTSEWKFSMFNNDSSRPASSDQRTESSRNSVPVFGEGNPLLAPQTTAKDGNKRRKPKQNINSNNSTWISRTLVHEHLSKKLPEKSSEATYAFANVNRAFEWLDLSSPTKQDYLVKILFAKAHCISHDVNQSTKSWSHLDVCLGFSTGEILWWEAVSQRYSRINKNCVINTSAVSQIKWLPGSENLFMAAHLDGTLVVYDRDREDASFVPEVEEGLDGNAGAREPPSRLRPTMQILKSVQSKNQKFNPVSAWKLSNQHIRAFAFSPDHRHVAIVSEDGSLRIMDFLKEILIDHLHSYYGSMECVCWSPDGKYIVTGGHDDCLSIWDVAESTLIAVCEGHQSWVTAVAFDPWRCDSKIYRFGSVGMDRRLCLWDFTVGMLPKPKAVMAQQRTGSVVSRNTASISHDLAQRMARRDLHRDDDGEAQIFPRPLQMRASVPILPPVSKSMISDEPLEWLQFTEDAVLTCSAIGHIRTWLRPSRAAAQADG